VRPSPRSLGVAGGSAPGRPGRVSSAADARGSPMRRRGTRRRPVLVGRSSRLRAPSRDRTVVAPTGRGTAVPGRHDPAGANATARRIELSTAGACAVLASSSLQMNLPSPRCTTPKCCGVTGLAGFLAAMPVSSRGETSREIRAARPRGIGWSQQRGSRRAVPSSRPAPAEGAAPDEKICARSRDRQKRTLLSGSRFGYCFATSLGGRSCSRERFEYLDGSPAGEAVRGSGSARLVNAR